MRRRTERNSKISDFQSGGVNWIPLRLVLWRLAGVEEEEEKKRKKKKKKEEE